MGFGDAEFPRSTGMLDRAEWGGSCAAFMSADENDIRMGLGHACGDGADACGGDELHAYAGAGIDLLQIVNELGQIFDRVDIMVRRWRNEGHALN